MRKNTKIILFIIVFGFFLRELSLVAIMPLFSGQDEPRHYNTVQILNESEHTWEVTKKSKEDKEKGQFETYNFSEEIRKTAQLAQTEQNPREYYKKMNFSESSDGINEQEIISQNDPAINKFYPPDIVGGTRAYHRTASAIEHLFENENILFRFFSVRIFSILLGTISVGLCFFIAKNVGFTEKESLLITAITSFQPKLSVYFSNINYDALVILSFTAFALAGVMSIKNGPSWKNFTALLATSLLATLTKGIGIILFFLLFYLILFHFYKKLTSLKKHIPVSIWISIFGIAMITLGFLSYFMQLTPNFPSLFDYLLNSIPKIPSSLENYWGDLVWSRNDYSSHLIRLIWLAEIVSFIGILFLFFKKNTTFFVKKEFLLFFILLIATLQASIRFYDWKIFSLTGSLELGTPGRYFLPTIIPHLILIFSGLGVIAEKRSHLTTILTSGLILMSSIFSHLLLNSIIPRYYF